MITGYYHRVGRTHVGDDAHAVLRRIYRECSLAPLAALAGDQQAATFGQACFAPGLAKNTYGTGCFLVLNTGAEPTHSKNRLLATIGWSRRTEAGVTRPTYALEGSVFTAGAVVQWLRDGLGVIRRSSDVEALALSVEDSGGVAFVPALTGLGAPHWDPYARGAVLGVTRGALAYERGAARRYRVDFIPLSALLLSPSQRTARSAIPRVLSRQRLCFSHPLYLWVPYVTLLRSAWS